MISKGYLYNIVRIKDFEYAIQPLELVLIDTDFPKAFLDDLLGIRPKKQIDFGIDLLPNTKHISMPPYRMSSDESK